MVYCAFPNQKKMPAATEITTMAIGGKECILFQEQTACKDSIVDPSFYNAEDIEIIFKKTKHSALGNIWITELIDLFPNSMWTDEKSVFGEQRDNWTFYYSVPK